MYLYSGISATWVTFTDTLTQDVVSGQDVSNCLPTGYGKSLMCNKLQKVSTEIKPGGAKPIHGGVE